MGQAGYKGLHTVIVCLPITLGYPQAAMQKAACSLQPPDILSEHTSVLRQDLPGVHISRGFSVPRADQHKSYTESVEML